MLSQADFEHKYAGTVKAGTLYKGDLIKAFQEALDYLEADSVPVYKYEVLAWDKLDYLFDTLDAIANEYGYTFSAHPDDGACFGFWKLDN